MEVGYCLDSTETKKPLIVINGLSCKVGGGWTSFRELTYALASIEISADFLLLVYSSQASAFDKLPTNFRLRVVGRFLDLLAPKLLWEQCLLPLDLRRLKIDLYFSLNNYGLLWSACPQVIYLQNSFNAQTYEGNIYYRLWWMFTKALFRQTSKRARHVIVASETLKEVIRDIQNLDPGKIITVNYGVSTQFTQTPSDSLKKSWLGQWGRFQPYFLFVGDFYPHKNIEVLIRASPFLLEEKPPAFLIFIGRQCRLDLKRNIDSQIEALGIGSRILFLSSMNPQQLKLFYHHAVALIMPSLAESFGLPVVEAMACGTPVIASDIPVMHEICSHAALYFNPKDSQDLADKMRQMLRQRDFRSTLILNGYRQSSRFSWERAARETWRVFQKSL